jgi:NAD(P)-dependent dehydrogenase (short-subunit alcohol dehydrogenase family)
MAGELADKVAVVTGGASGIGRGTVERFVDEGARVVIADMDRDRGEAVAAACGDTTVFKQTDVADQAQVRDLVDFAVTTFGGLDVMFNNAGISGARHPRLLDDDFVDFDRVMRVNLLGVMVGTREATRHMATNGGGSVINVSSIGGIQPAPGLWSYHTSKSSVIMFTKCAALDVGQHGVRVNCIAPGNIETPILGSVMAADLPDDEKAELMVTIREYLMSRQAIKRQGSTADIAEAAVFLASDRASYITGTVLPVDGGMVAGVMPAKTGIEAIRKAATR